MTWVAAAFSDEVLREGLNSDLLEPEPDALQAVVLRVLEHEEAAPKPLEAVRAEIEKTLRERRAAEAALDAAREMVKGLDEGGDFAALAGSYAVRKSGLVTRDAGGVPAMCDGVTQGQAGMELSLFSRDVIALVSALIAGGVAFSWARPRAMEFPGGKAVHLLRIVEGGRADPGEIQT